MCAFSVSDIGSSPLSLFSGIFKSRVIRLEQHKPVLVLLIPRELSLVFLVSDLINHVTEQLLDLFRI